MVPVFKGTVLTDNNIQQRPVFFVNNINTNTIITV